MPKPLLGTQKKTTTATHTLSATVSGSRRKTEQIGTLELNRMLRARRSKSYLDAMQRLDAGGHVQNQEQVNEIIHTIRNEFPEVELAGVMLGVVSICYLGKPYEVHTLDMTGGIIQHFKAGELLPYGMEKARSLAMRGGYAFIEVYTDCCRAVSSNGTVSVIPC